MVNLLWCDEQTENVVPTLICHAHGVMAFFYKCDLYRHSCPCDSSSTDKTRSSSTVESSRSVLDGALYADSSQINRDLKKHVLNRRAIGGESDPSA